MTHYVNNTLCNQHHQLLILTDLSTIPILDKGIYKFPYWDLTFNMATASSTPVLLNLLSREAHQLLLANNAVRAIKCGQDSPRATLNSPSGVLLEDWSNRTTLWQPHCTDVSEQISNLMLLRPAQLPQRVIGMSLKCSKNANIHCFRLKKVITLSILKFLRRKAIVHPRILQCESCFSYVHKCEWKQQTPCNSYF